jgi:hypothetical protein
MLIFWQQHKMAKLGSFMKSRKLVKNHTKRASLSLSAFAIEKKNDSVPWKSKYDTLKECWKIFHRSL